MTLPILLVEDDALDAKAVARAFRIAELPHDLTRVVDGMEALEHLRSGVRPAFILLDLNLPGMHGLEVMRSIRADASLCSLPVVVLTTSNEPSDRATTYALGAAGYFVKPPEFDRFVELCRAIHRYWGLCESP